MPEKINHTPGPWNFNSHFFAAWVEGDLEGERSAVADVLERVTDGELIALAPTAPHDCDVPDCPGPKNLRKLEAAQRIADALEGANDAIRDLLADPYELSVKDFWQELPDQLVRLVAEWREINA